MRLIRVLRVTVLLVMVGGIGVDVPASATGCKTAGESSSAAPDMAPYAPLPAAATSLEGVTLTQHSGTESPASFISQSAAVAAADARTGSSAATATSLTVTFGDFSDSESYTTMRDGSRHYAAQGTPAFVVAFHGVKVPLHSANPNVSNSELDVVIDARTGAVIEEFSSQ